MASGIFLVHARPRDRRATLPRRRHHGRDLALRVPGAADRRSSLTSGDNSRDRDHDDLHGGRRHQGGRLDGSHPGVLMISSVHFRHRPPCFAAFRRLDDRDCESRRLGSSEGVSDRLGLNPAVRCGAQGDARGTVHSLRRRSSDRPSSRWRRTALTRTWCSAC